MALTKCFECAREVSTTAPTCPGCGAVLNAAALPATPPAQSGSNAGAAIASFFIPGLGQVIQGRPAHGALFFFGSLVLWPFYVGWILHLVSAFEAGAFKPEGAPAPAPPAPPQAPPADVPAAQSAEASTPAAPNDQTIVFGLPLSAWLVFMGLVAVVIAIAAFMRP